MYGSVLRLRADPGARRCPSAGGARGPRTARPGCGAGACRPCASSASSPMFGIRCAVTCARRSSLRFIVARLTSREQEAARADESAAVLRQEVDVAERARAECGHRGVAQTQRLLDVLFGRVEEVGGRAAVREQRSQHRLGRAVAGGDLRVQIGVADHDRRLAGVAVASSSSPCEPLRAALRRRRRCRRARSHAPVLPSGPLESNA